LTRTRSIVRGVGSYLPKRVLTNHDLAKFVDTSHDWIVQRTGIEERHIADDGETTSFLGIRAAQAALDDAGLKPDDIDLIICATSTPDYTFPSTATQIQTGLGITNGAAFDLQAVCTGFVYAVSVADKFLASGSHKRALVIGAETFSRLLDWNDRTTCVLFGDGAGAIVLEASEGEGTSADRGVLTSHLRSDGRYRDKLYVSGGPGSTKTTGVLKMEGKEVFRFAVGMVMDVMRDAFAATGTTADDLAWFVPHQANRAREGRDHRGQTRQHLRRLDSAGARRGTQGRAHQGWRSGDDRGHRRRLHLGQRPDPLVRRRLSNRLT
jgi:3-oxoacyl-[acyl-carrier-protein] synthase III